MSNHCQVEFENLMTASEALNAEADQRDADVETARQATETAANSQAATEAAADAFDAASKAYSDCLRATRPSPAAFRR